MNQALITQWSIHSGVCRRSRASTRGLWVSTPILHKITGAQIEGLSKFTHVLARLHRYIDRGP